MAFREASRSFLLFLARLGLAGIFLWTAYKTLGRVDERAVRVAAEGYPYPKVMAYLSLAAQIGGGLAVLLGAFTTAGCVALILFLLPTTYSFHLAAALDGDARQQIDTLKNLAIAGGLVLLAIAGPGAFSVDGKRGRVGR